MENENYYVEDYFSNESGHSIFIYVGEFGAHVKKCMEKICCKEKMCSKKDIYGRCSYIRKEIEFESANQPDFGNKIQLAKNTIKRNEILIVVICGDGSNAQDSSTMKQIAKELSSEARLLYSLIAKNEEDDCEISGLENYMTYTCDTKLENSAYEIAKILFALESFLFKLGVIGLDWVDFYRILKYKKVEVCTFCDSDKEIANIAKEEVKKMIVDNGVPCYIFLLLYSGSCDDIDEICLDDINEIGNEIKKVTDGVSDDICILPHIVLDACVKEKQVVLGTLNDNILPYRKVLPQYGIFSESLSNNLAIKKDRYMCVDMETSGIDVKNDEIIKLSAAEIVNGRFHSMFETLVKPKKEISNLITEITGIKNSELENPPNIEDVMQEFKKYCSDAILVGHNIKSYAMQFLNEFAKKGIIAPFENQIIDTLEIAKESVFYVENYKLATLCERLEIEEYQFETRKEDIILTAELFSKIYKKQVKVGIFWALENGVFVKHQSVELSRKTISKSAMSTGKIDSDFGHDTVWSETFGTKGDVDFATYPRGRVLYDYINSKHVIFVDECITNGEIEEILKIFDVEDYSLEYDEHYRCDGCLEF